MILPPLATAAAARAICRGVASTSPWPKEAWATWALSMSAGSGKRLVGSAQRPGQLLAEAESRRRSPASVSAPISTPTLAKVVLMLLAKASVKSCSP